MYRIFYLCFLVLIVSLFSCAKTVTNSNSGASNSGTKTEPDYIKVQHILIGFQGSVPRKPITRSKEEAEKLAKEVLERARKGEDFGNLVKEYTADSFPGIYGISNNGKPGKVGYMPRNQMVPAFGDTGFPLAVGEIGLAVYSPEKSPYGWHIVKRIE